MSDHQPSRAPASCPFQPIRLSTHRHLTIVLLVLLAASARGEGPARSVATALAQAGDNKVRLQAALDQATGEHREGMEFLIVNMPASDLQSLSAEFLREHVTYAYKAWHEGKWHDQVPKEIFLNYVLPYSSIDERRDPWRKDLYGRFSPLVAEAKSLSEAAAILNQKVFPLVDVKYSRGRPKANQSPYESMEANVASCSGLSVLLIDACRAVGVPARFVGTPLWSDGSGNHSWVEVWDDGWHFTGAAEPSGNELNKAWFVGRASQAVRDDPRHAIYAASFRRTPLHFPLVWNPRSQSVYAVNVTERYTRQPRELPPGSGEVMFCVWDRAERNRVAARIRVTDSDDKLVFSGTSNDERFDGNDHLRAVLKIGESYEVTIAHKDAEMHETIRIAADGQLFRFVLPP